MNIADAVGKKILVEPSGTSLTDEEKRLLAQVRPAAIMFRKRNFLQNTEYEIWFEAYRKLIEEIKEIVGRPQMIWSVDHEGGRVNRFPAPITAFPYAAFFGASTEEVAQAMAVELKACGINVNFAPVADIHSNSENPVINERAFGRTSESVRNSVLGFARTLQKNGVAACPKHFPGHGDTKIDSHFGLPSLNFSLPELRERELIPFQALIDLGVPMIMTAHIIFSAIDPARPATFSKRILHDLLREEMGFKGVVIADALGMKAVSSEIRTFEMPVEASNAGLDIFLMAGDNVVMEDALLLAKNIENGLANGKIAEGSFYESTARIDSFLESLPQYKPAILDSKTLDKHHALADLLSKMAPWSQFDLSLPGFE